MSVSGLLPISDKSQNENIANVEQQLTLVANLTEVFTPG